MQQIYTPQHNYKVLVRTITYNQANYITDTLDGVAMQQTNFPIVHYVIDDCSTDGEQEVIKAWINVNCDLDKIEYIDLKLANIILVPHKTNQNISFAIYLLKRNLWKEPQIKETLVNPWREHCEYVALCEGDDYWIDPDKLQKQVDFLDSHSDYSMCFHRAAVLDYIGNGSGLRCFDIENREYSFEELLNTWISPTASLMFRKECLEYPLVGKERMVCGDIPLALSCASTGKVRGMSDYMSVYRIQNGGVTYNETYSKSMIMRYPEYYEFLRDNFPKIDRKSINRRIADFYYLRSTLQSYRGGRWEDIKKAVKTNPLILKFMFRTLFGLLYPKSNFHR